MEVGKGGVTTGACSETRPSTASCRPSSMAEVVEVLRQPRGRGQGRHRRRAKARIDAFITAVRASRSSQLPWPRRARGGSATPRPHTGRPHRPQHTHRGRLPPVGALFSGAPRGQRTSNEDAHPIARAPPQGHRATRGRARTTHATPRPTPHFNATHPKHPGVPTINASNLSSHHLRRVLLASTPCAESAAARSSKPIVDSLS